MHGQSTPLFVFSSFALNGHCILVVVVYILPFYTISSLPFVLLLFSLFLFLLLILLILLLPPLFLLLLLLLALPLLQLLLLIRLVSI